MPKSAEPALLLLDTCIVSDVLRERAPGAPRFRAHLAAGGRYALSTLTWYERVRSLRARQADRQIRALARFCREAVLFEVAHPILDRAADLWVQQRARGRPVPEVDLLIAATASVAGLTVATRDTDFLAIEGIDVAWWGDGPAGSKRR